MKVFIICTSVEFTANGPAVWFSKRYPTTHPGSPEYSGLATKLSRCKEGMAWFLQVMAQKFLSITCVAVQT
jgi:hypothetical protein